MNIKNHVITEFRYENRVRVVHNEHSLLSTLDALDKNLWYEYQKHDDLGHVANVMVKLGLVADHAEALHLLNLVHSDGKE